MENLEKPNDLAVKVIKFSIIMNAVQKTWGEESISFEQVVILAFGSISADPNTIYTVTFKKGNNAKPEGSMVRGDYLKVKEGMIFNATSTSKS